MTTKGCYPGRLNTCRAAVDDNHTSGSGRLDLRLALATCVVAPLVAYLLVTLGQVIRRLGTVAQQRMGGLSTILQEQLQGFSTVKGYQTEEFESERFSTVNLGYRRMVVRAVVWSAVLNLWL